MVDEEREDYTWASSAEDIKSFMDSFMWKDIRGEIEVWLERIRDALEDPSGDEDEESTESLRGSAKALRRVLALPGITREAMMEDRDDSERKSS